AASHVEILNDGFRCGACEWCCGEEHRGVGVSRPLILAFSHWSGPGNLGARSQQDHERRQHGNKGPPACGAKGPHDASPFPSSPEGGVPTSDLPSVVPKPVPRTSIWRSLPAPGKSM